MHTLEELEKLIAYHNDLYWKKAAPEISDVEYDELMRELEVLAPDHPLLSGFLKKIAVPMVQTSANASGKSDPLSCGEALSQLAGKVDCVVDGGDLPPGARGSTVVNACGEKAVILRQGAVDLQKWL